MLLLPLSVTALSLAAACLLVPLWVTRTVVTERLAEAGQAHGVFGATALALSITKLVVQSNAAQLQATLQDLSLKDPQLSRILVVDAKGEIVFDSKAELQGSPLEGFEGAWGDIRSELVSKDGDSFFRADAPIFSDDGVWGFVRADYKMEAANELSAVADRFGLISACIAMPAALGLTGLIVRKFLRALRRCTEVLDQGAKGVMNVRTGLAPRHELSRLVNAVDNIMGRIQEDSKKAKERCEVLEERLGARAEALDKLTQELEELKELTKES